MQLPIVTAALFITGTLLSLSPVSSLNQKTAASEFARSEFALGELTLNETEESLSTEVANSDSENSEEKPKVAKVAKPKETYVTVVKGDTLSKIAKSHNTTYKRIFDANKKLENPDILNIGIKLRIPRADEKLASRNVPKPKLATSYTSSTSTPVATNAPAVASGSVWDQLAACESGGNWQINTGNGYYGGLQFLPSTWRAVGGTGLPHQHSREEQIKRAEILLARSGWGQWPACTAKLGLR